MADKFPTTSGGAAGSFVRGNEFYQAAPTPYSSTRRGQDTISVTPGHISVKRASTKPPEELRPNLYAALRHDYDTATKANIFSGASNLLSAEVRRIYGFGLQTPTDPAQTVGVEEQDWVWFNPNTYTQLGHLTYVGDGYFVSVAGAQEPQWIDSTAFTKIALVHVDNLNGPYFNTTNRLIEELGKTVPTPAQAARRGGYRPGGPDWGATRNYGRFRDRRGANYLLREAMDLFFRVAPVGNMTLAGRGAGISVVPLGWYDPTYRYIFAVYGLSISGMNQTRYRCFVYSTGTRGLLHPGKDLPQPDARPAAAPYWVGMMETTKSIPRLTPLGRGRAAAIMVPTSKLPGATPGEHHISGHTMVSGMDLVMMYTTDFGHNWFKRYLPELKSLAIATPLSDYPAAGGGHQFAELNAQMAPIGAGRFLMTAMQLTNPLVGAVPNPVIDGQQADALQRGLKPDQAWYLGGGSSSRYSRYSTLTIFSGDIESGLTRERALDGLNIRLFHPAYDLEMREAAGTYRYRVLMNTGAQSATPCILPLGVGAAGLIEQEIELTLPETGPSPNRQLAVHHHIQAHLRVTLDAGKTWRAVPLPKELLSYRDEAETAKAIAEGYTTRALPEDAPHRDYLPWCVVRPNVGPKLDMVLAFHTEEMLSSRIFLVRVREDAAGAISLAVQRKISRKGPPAEYPSSEFNAFLWDFAYMRPPSGLMMIGDGDEFPDVPVPALPKLLL